MLEKEPQLGGQVVWAVRVTNRAEFGDIVRNLLHEIDQLDINVRTGVTATEEAVLVERPDAVVIATGSIPDRATIPGADGAGVADVTDILRDNLSRLPLVVLAREARTFGLYAPMQQSVFDSTRMTDIHCGGLVHVLWRPPGGF